MNKTVFKFRAVILSLCTVMFSVNLTAQSNQWTEYYSNEKIKIEWGYQVCDFSSTASQEMVVFKFTNLTDEYITLSYTQKITMNNSQENSEQNKEEFRKIITLKKNENISTNCENIWKEYNIFSAFIDNMTQEKYTYLNKFELENLTIE